MVSSTHLQAQTPYNIYFGDIHAQTWYSDGNQDQNTITYTKPVARSITYARDVAGNMDFLGISDHNHNESLNMTIPYWRSGFVEADSVNQDGVFAGFYGQEWGTISTGGHALIYGTDKLFGWNPGLYDVYVPKGDYTRLFDSLKKYNGFCYLAHPDPADYDGIFSNAYNATWDSVVMGVSVKNGPAMSTNTTETNPSSSDYVTQYHDLLRKGYHIAPSANQDNHYTNFGMTNQQRTAVLATSLTRANVLDALRNRRTYATEDHNFQLRFEVGTHQMGEIFSQSGSISFRIKVVDADAPAYSTIELRYGVPGSGTAPTVLTSVSNRDSLIFSQSQAVGTTYYYYAYVRESNGRQAWSAPMWITIPTGPMPGAFALSAPSNSSGNQPISGTLTWQSSQDATQYDVYLDTNNPPTTIVSANQAGTSYNYSGLLNNAVYRWKIVAKNTNGTTVASGAPWSFTTIVASPSSFNLTSPTNGATSQTVSGAIFWQSSTNATQYDVYLDTNSSPVTLVSADQSGTTFNYSNLLDSKNYYWKIVAKNVAGNVVGTGAPWMFTTKGPSPSAFTLSLPSNNALALPLSSSLIWNSSTFATTYDVYLDGSNPPTTLVASNLNDTVYNYTFLNPGTLYYWKVVAKNNDDTTIASNAPHNFTTVDVPLSPSNFASNNIATTSIDLSWNDNADNEDGYRIYRAISNSGPFSQVGNDLPANTVSFTDTGLNINQRYYYKAIPFNDVGEGNFVAINLSTLALTPGAPMISSPGYFSVTVVIDPSVNPASTQFAIRIVSDTLVQFVQGDGSVGVLPAWRTYTEWGGINGITARGLHPCATYEFIAIARNLDSIQTSYSSQANQTLPCYSISQSTASGWNLMSLPVTVSDERKTIVFPTSASDAFFYQGSYVSRDTLKYGEGFWLKYDDIQTINLSGEPRLDDSLLLKPGWNIIGSVANPVSVNDLVTQPTGIVVSNYFGFDGAYVIADSIRPLKGYWVKANASGSLMLTSALNSPIARFSESGESASPRMSSIRFEDRLGRSQTLFVSNEPLYNHSLQKYILPPIPPAGSFDVRFKSQRLAEIAKSGDDIKIQSFPVEVQGVVYPLHISWDIAEEVNTEFRLHNGSEDVTILTHGDYKLIYPSSEISIEVLSGKSSSLPKEFTLHQNYPNPFNPQTTIRYDLAYQTHVNLRVYDVLGRDVISLVNEIQGPGYKSIAWHAENIPSGLYYYRLDAGSFVQIKKMLVVR